VANIGVYGMGVMGSNLALNFADHGFSVAVCNVTPDLTDKVLREHPHEQIKPRKKYFVLSLQFR